MQITFIYNCNSITFEKATNTYKSCTAYENELLILNINRMNKAIKKPIEIEYITFEEFVQYGLNNTSNIVNGMPWSFDYKKHPITHENDECYLIPTLEGTHNFTPKDVLITGVKGEIYPCKIDIFEATYDKV